MKFRHWSDWVAIVTASLVWAIIGLALLDLFPGVGQGAAILVGWLISYVSLMGWLSVSRRDLRGLLAAGAFFLAVLGAVAYVIGLMLGVDGGIPN